MFSTKTIVDELELTFRTYSPFPYFFGDPLEVHSGTLVHQGPIGSDPDPRQAPL